MSNKPAGKRKSSLQANVTRRERRRTQPSRGDHVSASLRRSQSVNDTHNAMDVDLERARTERMAKVANDTSIFRPDGLIVFPRSDGDPTHRPEGKNFDPPDEGDLVYNYYHLCESDDDEILVRFKERVGSKLAELFGLPKDRDWVIHRLPDHYMLAMNFIKYPNIHQLSRRDHYLYGLKGSVFRSANEFAVHAELLLCDPSMRRSTCRCKYCKGGTEWRLETGDLGTGQSRQKSASSPSSSSLSPSRPSRSRRLKCQQSSRKIKDSSYQIRAQKAPDGQTLPGVPVFSTNQRSFELSVAERHEQGAFEGFREGEYAFLSLAEPVRHTLENANAVIHSWPVHIIEMGIRSTPDPLEPFCSDVDAPFEGNVIQTRVYTVNLLGTKENISVDESRLTPLLAQHFSEFPCWSSTNGVEQADDAQESTTLNLENGQQRASWNRIAQIYQEQLHFVKAMRAFYTLTDPFSRKRWGQSPPIIDVGEQTANDLCPENGHESLYAGHSNYMEVDNDDSNAHRRRASDEAAGSKGSVETGTDLVNDTNQYWQGLYLGVERIWVGDLVRMCLRITDAKRMFAVMTKSNNLYNRQDKNDPRLDCQFVLRIKAIYRAAEAISTETDDKVRVAGDVFRVVNCEEYDRENEERERTSRMEQEERAFDDRAERLAPRRQSPKASRSNAVSDRSKQTSSRPSFLIPLRPFLEPSHEQQLPLSPRMPEGYGLQRINQSCIEVVFSVQQIAGRLYPSLVAGKSISSHSLRRARFAKPTIDDESLYSDEECICSLAGLLPGFVKAMGVRTKDGQAPSRPTMCENAMREAKRSIARERPSPLVGQDKASVSDTKTKPSTGRARSDSTVLDEGCEVIDSVEETEKGSRTANLAGSSWADERESSPPLPAPWIKQMSKSRGAWYYANKETKETRWSRPPGV